MDGNPHDAGFDLTAAGLRANRADLPGFVEVLATALEQALPDLCVVERRRGLLVRKAPVERIAVRLGRRRFLLHWRRRELIAERESSVHDMRRTVDELPLEAWLAELEDELRRQAATSAEARAALERLLNG